MPRSYISIQEVVARFPPHPMEELKLRKMRAHADQLGKRAFFENVPNARPASPAEVRRFIEGLGFTVGECWEKVALPGGIVRQVNIGWSDKVFDAFVGDQPAELKPTTINGVGGLTYCEERLGLMGKFGARVKDKLERPCTIWKTALDGTGLLCRTIDRTRKDG